jgi:bifunctional non-homologous end joining protein LigD
LCPGGCPGGWGRCSQLRLIPSICGNVTVAAAGAGRYFAVMIPRRVLPVGFVEPCIPTLAAKPPSGPGWVHEIKHEGYRLIVRRDGDTVRLFTRRGHYWTDRYPAIASAAAKLRARSFTVDGEAVVTGADGVAVFDALHRRHKASNAMLYAFDLLEFNGEDLRPLPLAQRKAKLARLLARTNAGIALNEHTEADGATVFRQACAMGLEGIVSKRLTAPYRSGPSRDWIKVGRGDGSSARFGQYCRMGVRTRGLDITINAKRQVADAAARAEAKGVVERWNEQLAASCNMLWSPTIRAALIAGTPWLDVFCPGCGTSRAIDLRQVDRHPLASVATLVLGLRCSWCPELAPMPKLLSLHALPPVSAARARSYGFDRFRTVTNPSRVQKVRLSGLPYIHPVL